MPTSESLIALEVHPAHVVVQVHPDLTNKQWADVEALGQRVVRQLEARNNPTCLVDLSSLTYMGSGAVAFIVRLWKVIKSKDGRMAVVCNNEFVLEVLRLAALDKLWLIVPDYAEAYKQLKIRGVPPQTRAPAPSQAQPPPSRGGGAFALLAAAGLVLSMATVAVADRLQLPQHFLKGIMFGTAGWSLLFGLAGTLRGSGWRRPASAAVALAGTLLLVATALAQEVSVRSFADLVRTLPSGGEPGPGAPEDRALEAEPVVPVVAAEEDGARRASTPDEASPVPPAAAGEESEKEQSTTPSPAGDGAR